MVINWSKHFENYFKPLVLKQNAACPFQVCCQIQSLCRIFDLTEDVYYDRCRSENLELGRLCSGGRVQPGEDREQEVSLNVKQVLSGGCKGGSGLQSSSQSGKGAIKVIL